MPGLPGLALKEDTHHQRPGKVQPGDKAAHASGEDLPEPGGVLAAGDDDGGRAVRGMGEREALPEYGGLCP